LREVFSRLQELSSEIHRISYELHPARLDRLGLAKAAMSLCRDISKQHRIHLNCTIKDIPDVIPRNVSLCLYRVIHESLQNIVKHSGARNATVEMHGSSSKIRLRIADKGVGFRVKSAEGKGGLGLLSMRERLRIVGGTISIQSQPSRGTRIDVTIPLQSVQQNCGMGPD
jgi:signal transduction histidine kinase